MEGPYKVENVEIEKIYRSTTNRDGKPYVSSKGNPFTKVDIYIDARAIEDPKFEGKMTYFDYYDNTANWDIGSQITGEIVKNEVGDKTYFNFNLPASGKKALDLEIKQLKQDVQELQEEVFGKKLEAKKEEVKDALNFSKEALKEEPKEEEDDEFDLPF